MLSDFIFGPSFKVKRWFTGFCELSFWWIQICIGSPMCRSSVEIALCSNIRWMALTHGFCSEIKILSLQDYHYEHHLSIQYICTLLLVTVPRLFKL